jgi:putative peptidoglycan lipid II flippase
MPSHSFPQEGDGLAWGVLVGGFLQMALLVPALRRLGALPQLGFVRGNPDIRRVLRNMLPGVLGMGLLQLMTIVNLKYASGLGEGAISYIYWADRLLELPLSLVSVSLGTALLPTLATIWSQGRTQQMSDTANYYLRLNLFIAVPAALGLYFLALPIVEVLYMRGRFNIVDAHATAGVLKVYALLLVVASTIRVLVPAYYAIKNTWFPAVASGASLVLHIVLAPLLMKSQGLEGLMISAFLSATLNGLLLLLFFPKWIASFDFAKILKHFLKFLVAGAVMVAVLQIYDPLVNFIGPAFASQVLALAAVIVLGITVYGFVSWLVRSEELQAVKFKKQI